MLGDNIKKFRKETNMSQEALAEKVGVTRQSISLWENNQSQPSIETVLALARIFEKTTDELLSNTQENCTTESNPQNVIEKNKHSKSIYFIIAIVVTLILIGVGCFFLTPYFSDNKTNALTKNFSEDTEAIANAEASVVKVFCYDHLGAEIATGSGVVLFENDMIVTNYHVIDDVYSIKVSTDQDITYKVLNVWYQNEEQDLAILKLTQETTLTPLKIGDPSVLKKGETVTAIGSPLGIKNTVSKGNLSARIMQGDYDILQFTAPISDGSSGGALFNEKGEVVGITYASFVEGQNLNLAIPIDLAQKLYQSAYIDAISLEETYWEKHKDEYYEFTYGTPIEVTLSQLKNNPQFYDDKYIKITAHISSIDMFKDPIKIGFYLSDPKDVTKNIDNDKNKNRNSNFNDHPFLYVSDHKSLFGIEGEKIEVIGVFKYWKKGDFFNDAPLDYSKAYIDAVYLHGVRIK